MLEQQSGKATVGKRVLSAQAKRFLEVVLPLIVGTVSIASFLD
jgi:hypothetical protein